MAGKTSAKKSAKKGGRRGRVAGQKNKRKAVQSYQSYIYKVMKGLSKGKPMNIKKSTMSTLNSAVNDIFARLASEAGALCKYKKTQTLGSKEIQCATKLVFPAELASHAHQEGERAVRNYKKATN